MSGFADKFGMRVVPAFISFVVLLVFLAPFATGIINLGNCVGAFISGTLTAIFTFFKPFCRAVSHIWKYPAGKAAVSLISVAAVVFVITAIVISCFMVKAARDDPKGRATTIVVLGCKVKDGRPSLMLRRRLDAAYDYLEKYPDVTVIVSGGKGNDEIISEAECMKEYLASKGIASERIIMEDKSASTYENLKNSKEIIEKNGLNQKITIVSDGYHQLRAEMIASELGIEAYNISAPTSVWLIPTYTVREWFGVVYQFIF